MNRTRTRRAHSVLLGAALACALLALAACGGAVRPAAPPSPTPRPTATPTPPPVVLYQADWRRGLAGWDATPGWSVIGGAAQSDTGAEDAITVPYRPATAAFAVEFTVQVMDVGVQGASYYLAAAQVPGADGFSARVYGLRLPGPHPYADHPTINTFIDPMADEDSSSHVAGADFEPGDDFRTYRVVVQGASVALYVDGHFEVSTASSVTSRLATGPLRLVTKHVAVRVGMLRVTTL